MVLAEQLNVGESVFGPGIGFVSETQDVRVIRVIENALLDEPEHPIDFGFGRLFFFIDKDLAVLIIEVYRNLAFFPELFDDFRGEFER